MSIAEGTIRKVVNTRKSGTKYSEQEWQEYFKSNFLPVVDETRGFYQTLAGWIKKENTITEHPEKVAVNGVAK